MGLTLFQILRQKYNLSKKIISDPLTIRRNKKKFIMRLAIRYLTPEMYMFFIPKYTSNRTADNIDAKPIADYIIRRYEHGKRKGIMDRHKRDVHRRQQINERSDD